MDEVQNEKCEELFDGTTNTSFERNKREILFRERAQNKRVQTWHVSEIMVLMKQHKQIILRMSCYNQPLRWWLKVETKFLYVLK